MAVATLRDLMRKLRSPTQLLAFLKSGQLATGTHWNSEWVQTGDPAAAATPTTAAIPDNTLTGSLKQSNKAGSEQRVAMRRFGSGAGGITAVGQIALVDRLAHIGGLSGQLNTAQTVAFPSLTRYTSGVGVWAAAEIYTAVGPTGTTITMSYTNTVPTAGQTSQPVVFAGSGFQNARVVLPLSLAAGDVGVTAVASATLAAATGTTGNFGITLFKTLAIWPYNSSMPWPHSGDPANIPSAPMPAIVDGACLQLLHFGVGQVATQLYGELAFFED